MIKKYKIDFEKSLLPGERGFFKNLKVPCTYLSENHLEMWLRAPNIHNKNTWGIDIETYAIPEYEGTYGAGLMAAKSHIRTIQIYNGTEVVVLDFMRADGSNILTSDKTALGHVCTLLCNYEMTAHNAQFEVNHFTKLLEMNGTPSELLVHCTMNGYKLVRQAIDHTWDEYSASLKEVSKVVLGIDVDKDIQHDRWKVPGPLDDEQLEYCARDAILPYYLLEVLWANLIDFEMIPFYRLQTEVYNVLGHMHLFGAPIDDKWHDELIAQWEQKVIEAEHQCFNLLNKDKGFADSESCWQVVSNKVAAKQLKVVATTMVDFMVTANYRDSFALKELRDLYFQLAEEYKEERALRIAYSRAGKNLEEHLINPGSDKQLSDWVKAHVAPEILNDWPLTDSSNKYIAKCLDDGTEIDKSKIQLQMTNEAFDELDDLELIKPLIEFKKYSKLHSTYGIGLKKFYNKTPWGNGAVTIHGEYSTCSTETGRFSTSKPTVQNAPRDKDFRRIYITQGENYDFVSADFSQIELRFQAEITQDPVMLDVYEREDGDIHDTTAEGILRAIGKSRETVDADFWKKTRDASKNVNFACQYGGGAKAVKKGGRKSGVKLPLETWQVFVDAYRSTYNVAYQWQLSNADFCKQTMKVTIPYGKVAALWPDYAFTQACNFPIQGGSAVVLQISLRNMYRVYCARPDLDFRITKTVHDSIDLSVRKDCTPEVTDLLKQSMREGYLTVLPNATTATEKLIGIKIAKNWGECE